MTLKLLLLLAGVALSAAGAVASAADDASRALRTVTLYAPRDRATGNYNESRSWFSFEYGTIGEGLDQTAGDQRDLGYGFLAINDEDFFSVGLGSQDKRSVIRDMGALNWSDTFEVPVLPPLPALEKGQARTLTVDASAGRGERWERTNGVFAKAAAGHMYLVHVVDEDSDFYALFRIERIEHGESCTISWRLIPSPER